MKYVVVLLVVVVGLWLLLGRATGRGRPVARRPEQKPPPAPPAEMLACAHCGVHLPGDEALRDTRGRAFCCEAHRNAGSR